MKELDVLLESFLEQDRQALESGLWPEFEALLQHEDDVFWIWVQHPDHRDAIVYRDILERIRHGHG
jgi:succinate dehydrogenase flavin-adding protein (antitoxin of CptAB toxin-antitoxin module)